MIHQRSDIEAPPGDISIRELVSGLSLDVWFDLRLLTVLLSTEIRNYFVTITASQASLQISESDS